MEYQEILVRQYAAYIESKDRFVERTFLVNRFYMVLELVVTLLLCVSLEYQKSGVCSATIALSFAGLAISFLWMLNQDSYLYLIKVKLADVIEKMEAHLPSQPHVLEFDGIKERSKKMRVVFPEAQKLIAFVAFLAFFAVFVQNTGLKLLLFLKDLS